MQAILDFQSTTKRLVNSNGVDFSTKKGVYHLGLVFSARDRQRTTSFSGVQLSRAEWDRSLLEIDTVRNSLHQSIEHLQAKPVEGKFTGDVIVTPQALAEFLGTYTRIFLGNQALIAGTSRLKDKLNEQVASPKLTLHSRPTADEICDGYYVTPDGFAVQDTTLIEDGVLQTFLLDQYGANKTGKQRAKTAGGAYVVDTGCQSLDELIADVDRGLLVPRYSGGHPNSNGDFSGVAKNSFYIEAGEVQYPITETMIAGNLLELFQNVNGLSRERIDSGTAILPWVSSSGVVISGK
jgi:PmbA protein